MTSRTVSRRQWLFLALLALLAATTSPAATASDADADGIDDGVEFALASQFLPEIRYKSTEGCPTPNHRPVLFRLRHPRLGGVADTNFIAINYVRLYEFNCGTPTHSGDNESFLVFLKRNGGSWKFDSVSVVAHYATYCQVRSIAYSNRIWASRNNHAGFANLSQCQNAPQGCVNDCSSNGPSFPHTLYNVGEPSAKLINYMHVIQPTWGALRVWGSQQFMNGGNIESQLYTTPFVHSTTQFDQRACHAACDQQRLQCLKQTPRPQCEDDYDACRYSCDIQVRRWDP